MFTIRSDMLVFVLSVRDQLTCGITLL